MELSGLDQWCQKRLSVVVRAPVSCGFCHSNAGPNRTGPSEVGESPDLISSHVSEIVTSSRYATGSRYLGPRPRVWSRKTRQTDQIHLHGEYNSVRAPLTNMYPGGQAPRFDLESRQRNRNLVKICDRIEIPRSTAACLEPPHAGNRPNTHARCV